MANVQPSTVAELAALVRTQGDNLNDLADDLATRGVPDEVLAHIRTARDAAYEAFEAAQPKHTRYGRADGPWPYGATHDFDCPACVASGASYTSSPRSETYWSS